MQKILQKKDLNNFLKNLMKEYSVFAPVNKTPTKFEEIKNPKDIYLDKITEIPAKQLFLPENETLFKFNNNKISNSKQNVQKRIIFGLRLCELNALLVLDKVMHDPLYINKRKNTIVIGLYCENPDEFCFCNSMYLIQNCYDLFFYPDKDSYYISIGSKKGEELVKNLPIAKKQIIKQIKNKKKLINKDISKFYKNKIWESDASKCLSCSACTVYCPTCNCFNIEDKSDLNAKRGERVKNSASCQLKSFSRVAGGKIFRDSRLSRFKHFIYHKLVYFKNQHNVYMCVGCGRCLRVCPTHIDWTNTINLLNDTKNQKK